MTGTAGDIIPIVIVPVLALAFCIVMVYYADSHPRWGNQPPTDTVSTVSYTHLTLPTILLV